MTFYIPTSESDFEQCLRALPLEIPSNIRLPNKIQSQRMCFNWLSPLLVSGSTKRTTTPLWMKRLLR